MLSVYANTTGNDDTRIWMFAEPFAAILRDCTRLRGALLPYVYALAAQSSYESWPFSRPMWWDYGYDQSTAGAPAVEEAWHQPTQYLFGEVLVNPVTQWAKPTTNQNQMNASAISGAVNVSTWLPAGSSWSSWDGFTRWAVSATPTTGSIVHTVVQLAETPLFVREGAMVPMWPPGRRRHSFGNRTRVVALWPTPKGEAGSGQGLWYEDDGISLDYRRRVTEAATTASSQLKWLQTLEGQLTVTVTAPARAVQWSPDERTFSLQLRGVAAGRLASAQACIASSNATTTTDAVCTNLTKKLPSAAARTDGRAWSTAGWWTQGASEVGAESAVPGGTVVVVCPPLGLGHVLSVRVFLV